MTHSEARRRRISSEGWLAARLSVFGGQRLAWSLRCFEEAGSTMDEARALILAGEVGPDRAGLVIASRQSAGRGRLGRQWKEAACGLYVTFVFSSREPASRFAGLSLGFGSVICNRLRATGCDVGLKWPNDILSSDGRKLAGILIELAREEGAGGAALTHVLCGLGVNMSGAPDDLPDSCSVAGLGGSVRDPIELAALLAAELPGAFRDFERSGLSSFRESWLAQSVHYGRRLEVDLGHQIAVGEFAGISEQGALLIAGSDGTREIVSGQILKLPPLRSGYSGAQSAAVNA